MKKFFAIIFAAFFLFTGCGAKITVKENDDGTKNLECNLSMSKKLLEELKTISGDNTLTEDSFKFSGILREDIDFSKENAVKLYEELDEEGKSYADMLCAPIFTGDKMAVDEYEELLASLYGKDIAKEFVSGKIEIIKIDKKGLSKKETLLTGQFLCGL